MHPDEYAILQTIIDDPDDDVPRLVIADWYEENGNPERAEFIRVQIKLEGMKPNDPRYEYLITRQSELYKKHHLLWSQIITSRWKSNQFGIWSWDPQKKFANGYRRGFITSLLLRNVDAFLRFAPELYQIIPLQFVMFGQNSPKDYLQLIESPFLARLRGLRLTTGNSLEEWRRFCSSPNLSNLRILVCDPKGRFANESMKILACSPSLKGIEELQIDSDPDWDGLESILQADVFPQLQILCLPQFRLSEWKTECLIWLMNERKEVTIKLSRNSLEIGISIESFTPFQDRLNSVLGERIQWL
jgi:uncharacterized protein (TIGR02996 family)